MQACDPPTIAAHYARWGLGLQWQDLPSEVVLQAQHLVLDALGIALASSRYPFAQQTLLAVQDLAGSAGPVPVMGMGAHLPARDAALVNGLLIHGLDYDDTHPGSVVHATASVWAAAFSVACQQERSGSDLLLAYVAGMEVACRVGLVAGGVFHKAGFHPTAVAGIFGCVVAAARLWDLDAAQTVQAQGIALSMAAGTLEFLKEGAGTKRLHPGWAASSAIAAVALARRGMSGPSTAYEGQYGLYASHLGPALADCQLSLATQGLGQVWELMRVAVKPIPACHFVHACIDAAVALRPALAQGEISHIVARVAPGFVPVVCEPVSQKRRPSNAYEAQFSVQYGIATALRHGKFGLQALDASAMQDPATLAFADQVICEVDPQADYPRYFPGEVVLHFTDGRQVSHREPINRGAPGRPIAHADIVAKYMDNAGLAWPASAAQALRQTLMDLPQRSACDLAREFAGAPA